MEGLTRAQAGEPAKSKGQWSSGEKKENKNSKLESHEEKKTRVLSCQGNVLTDTLKCDCDW